MRRMLSLAVSVTIAVWPAATSADDKGDCRDNKDGDLRIKVCSVLIQRDPKDATAYHNRGVAYQLKGDLDRAIADYNTVIELRPNDAPAYESRGRAYASKGDYTRAVSDVTKAGELIPKPALQPKAITTGSPKVTAKPAARAKSSLPSKQPVADWPDWAPGRIGN